MPPSARFRDAPTPGVTAVPGLVVRREPDARVAAAVRGRGDAEAARRAVRIRPAVAADVPLVMALIRELAAEEGAEGAVVITAAALRAHGFGRSPRFRVLLAERGGVVVGYASYVAQFSIWQGAECVALDDLYVRPAARGGGVGAALMRAVAAECRRRGVRARWGVRPANAGAIRFYERLGATVQATGVCTWSADAIRGWLAAEARTEARAPRPARGR